MRLVLRGRELDTAAESWPVYQCDHHSLICPDIRLLALLVEFHVPTAASLAGAGQHWQKLQRRPALHAWHQCGGSYVLPSGKVVVELHLAALLHTGTPHSTGGSHANHASRREDDRHGRDRDTGTSRHQILSV